MEGVDYAWDRPDPAGMHAAGVRFAGRYVGPGSLGKHLTTDEAHRLADAGIGVVSLAEGTADGALGGHNTGYAHARSARDHARRVGMPDGRPIYFAVDFDAGPAALETVANYFRGVAEVLPHKQIGVYGGIRTIDYLMPRGLASWGFQTYAWSGGRWSPLANLRQYRNHVEMAGGTVDLCRAMVADIGQWSPGGTDMLSDEQANQLATILHTVTALDDGDGGRIPLQVWGSRLAATVAGLEAKLADLAAIVAPIGESAPVPVTLDGDAREAIVSEVRAALGVLIGPPVTATEVAEAVITAVRGRLEA